MSAALAWAGGAVAVFVLLFSVYLVLVYRALRNERVISIAIAAMHGALADEPPPQRALLGAVAGTLAEQERAAARIEVTIYELAQNGHQPPPAGTLLGELFALPEPHLLIADFLGEFGGGPGSGAIVTKVAADLLQAATLEVFGDLGDGNPVQLERLLLLAAEGKIVPVAQAAWDASADAGPLPYRAPRAADAGLTAMLAIAQSLDRAVRRQLRLITLLHGQAEAILRLRRHEQRGPAVLWARVRQTAHFPLARRPRFQPGDLAVLVTTFDAVGEIVDTAEKRLAEGEPASAVHLLAGLRVPVPEGLPGRIYHQECLAQVRPLAAVAVRHRLAVSRWVAAALQTARGDRMNPSAFSGSMIGSTDRAGDDGGDAR